MFKNKISLIIALSILSFSCTDEENLIKDSVAVDYEYKLQNQLIDSISIYTVNGKIDDLDVVIDAANQAELNLLAIDFPKDISYTGDTSSIIFLSNSKVEFASTSDVVNVYDFNITKNLITIYSDTLMSYGYDESHADYLETQYLNHIKRYKPVIFSQKNVFLGYTSALETKLSNYEYFYSSGDQLIQPIIFYVHIVSFEGRQYPLNHGELNNEFASDGYKVLNPGDSLLVFHMSRIYQ